MSLAIFTALCGMLVAPVAINPVLGFAAVLAIALGAGACGALNQWYEVDVDAAMRERTAQRPLPAGRWSASRLCTSASVWASSPCCCWAWRPTGWRRPSSQSILYYLLVYTVWLKPRTPQNIVIGGAAGAFPPLIGWAAAMGTLDPLPWLLFALIFLWTPPHFWALSLFMRSDYAAAGIPMLPVVAGERSTRAQIFIYTLPMAAAAVAPWPLGYTGPVYGWVACALTAAFIVMAARVAFRTTQESDRMKPERQLFAFSILYLFILFAAVVADRWWPLT